MANALQLIQLKGGDIHYTSDSQQHYLVRKGQVLVYVLPLREGYADRRFLICEKSEGERIPALSYMAAFNYESDEICRWCFGLVAVDKAELEIIQEPLSEEIKVEFARESGIRSVAFMGFEECCVEEYQLRITKELRNIYTATQEQEDTKTKSLETIYSLFQSRKQQRFIHEKTGNNLYDAVVAICDKVSIPVVPLEQVLSSCGRTFSIEDIARLSHFISRDIVLSGTWFKQDSGPILAYYNDSKQAVACLPRGANHYECYDPSTGETIPVTAEVAEKLNPKAKIFYRPFPAKSLNLKELFKFGIKQVYISDIISFFFLALLGTCIGLLIPFINEKLYDIFIPMGDKNGLLQVCWVVLACTVGNITFTVTKNMATFRSVSSLQYPVQAAAYDRLFNLPESFFRKFDSADLAQRVMGIGPVVKIIAQAMLTTGLSAFFSLLYMWRMFRYSGKLTWFSLLLLLVSMTYIAYLGWRQTKYEAQLVEKESAISSRLYQLLSGVDKLRMAGVEDRALYEYLKPYTDSKKITIKKERIENVVQTITLIMPNVFSLLLYYLLIKKTNSNLSMGAFMGFTAAFGSFSSAMLQAVSCILTVNDVVPVYERAKPILETLPELEEDSELPGELSGEIEINSVTFSYSPDSAPVLNNLTMNIKAGEYIGIVGPSGCGKSTLLKLLLGFEKPQSGKVFYDGRDIEGIDKRELRKKFGVVLQDGKLISGSIYENIVITAPNTSMKRVKEVVREVGLEADIEQMPMGLHTVLSEDSGTISGGQQQRILIARAIVSKPRIIFFDEATSALDNVTQSKVSQSIDALKATRIVIAHRLSTIMKCDRIYVLDKGCVQECGNYDELMSKKGMFYELARRQM